MVDFVEINKVCARKAIIEAAKRVINSDKLCRSYSDLNFEFTFLEHSVFIRVDNCVKKNFKHQISINLETTCNFHFTFISSAGRASSITGQCVSVC